MPFFCYTILLLALFLLIRCCIYIHYVAISYHASLMIPMKSRILDDFIYYVAVFVRHYLHVFPSLRK